MAGIKNPEVRRLLARKAFMASELMGVGHDSGGGIRDLAAHKSAVLRGPGCRG